MIYAVFVFMLVAVLAVVLGPLWRARHRRLAVGAALLASIGAGAVYAYLGSPELPAKPYADRKNDPDILMASAASRLASGLAEKPDADGYAKLGVIYVALRDYDKAAEAYQQSLHIKDGNANRWSGYGEALALSQNGMVTPEAHEAFVKALRHDRRDARARFFLGLAALQADDPRGAIAIWRDLAQDGAPDAPWLGAVKERIAATAKKSGIDPETVGPRPPSLVSTDVTAIMGMKAEDRMVAIRGMVDRLAARLKDNPGDIEGWRRLAKSYRVLGDVNKAEQVERKIQELEGKRE